MGEITLFLKNSFLREGLWKYSGSARLYEQWLGLRSELMGGGSGKDALSEVLAPLSIWSSYSCRNPGRNYMEMIAAGRVPSPEKTIITKPLLKSKVYVPRPSAESDMGLSCLLAPARQTARVSRRSGGNLWISSSRTGPESSCFFTCFRCPHGCWSFS